MTPQIQERDPLPKRVLKRTFLVGDKVGSGGVYDVYLARQLSAANRKVAVKVMKKALCTSDSDEVKIHRDHFQFEVGLLSNLRGGCFTALFDAGEFDDAGALRPYLVTDFLAGKTLAERIHEGKRLRLCEGLGLFLLVAEGLMEMHRYDVVYRDLSPNNVILQEISTCSIMPRLFDFSHAGPISGSLGVDKRKGNWVLVGTPPFAAPELTVGQADSRTDVYSLAAVLYFALTGQSPLKGSNGGMTWRDYITALKQNPTLPAQSLRQCGVNAPRQLDEMLAVALRPQPKERFPDLQTFVQAVTALLWKNPQLLDGLEADAGMMSKLIRMFKKE